MKGLEFGYSTEAGCHRITAFDDEYAIGFIEWKPDGNVTLVYVTVAYRRRGVGRALLSNSVEFARKMGIPEPTHSTSYTPSGSALMYAHTGEQHEPTLDPDQKVKVAA